jgi:mono/diheme cytochrome c family protein
MRRWPSILAAILVLCGLLVVGGLGFIYSGIYNIAATEPHWPLTRWILETARNRSIDRHAAGIRVPPGLDEETIVVKGVSHFAAHCAMCHGAPGVPRGEIAKGLYPEPPALDRSAANFSDAELFWIVKHGIKMTGMPSWADHGDEEIWATVAFVKKLPAMDSQEYARLLMLSIRGGGHRHGDDARPPAGDGGQSASGNHPGSGHEHRPHRH